MSQVIKKFDRFVNEIVNASYTQEWPMNKQEVGVNQDDVAGSNSVGNDYYKHENKFQEVQEYMKIILKPMLLKKNKNANDQDIDKVSNSFFNLGGEKASEVKKMVDTCKDTKQCAQEIVNRYYKYVKINFGTKDDINNVEQDSVMTSEGADKRSIKYLNPMKPSRVRAGSGVCEECDGRGFVPGKGKCKACGGTGLSKSKTNKSVLEGFEPRPRPMSQQKWLDIFFRVLVVDLEKGYEEKVIDNFEKMDRKEVIIKNDYFINKVDFLIAKSRELNCKNVEDFLINYKENL